MNENDEKPKKAIVLAGDRGLEFRTLDEMYRFCVACASSREFKDIQTPEQALIRLQAGLELGLSPIWSLVNIMVVNGRPSVWGDGALAIVQNHAQCEDVIETHNEGKTEYFCEVKRKGRVPVKRSFSIDDAKRAALWAKSGPWQQYPQRMLQMRARAWALRDSFSDALRGLGIVEEVRDFNREQPAKAVEVKPLVLPDEISPAPVLAEAVEPTGVNPSEARESINDRSQGFETRGDSRGGGKQRRRRKKAVASPPPAQEAGPGNGPHSSRSTDVTPEQVPISESHQPESNASIQADAQSSRLREVESDKNPGPSHSGPGDTPDEDDELPF